MKFQSQNVEYSKLKCKYFTNLPVQSTAAHAAIRLVGNAVRPVTQHRTVASRFTHVGLVLRMPPSGVNLNPETRNYASATMFECLIDL